ncbi:MAG: hypothetical protein FWH11_04560 [Micrococcales bacterium]|nr:hypothetical protein [Micrococcales bacterium]
MDSRGAFDESRYLDDAEQLVGRLQGSARSDDFESTACEAVGEFNSFDDPSIFVGPVIRLIENNPDIDFGSPGPLVHFVERFYGGGYENLLVSSLERRPTSHTVWMLRRIINDPACPGRQEYIDLLRKAGERDDVDEDVKRTIRTLLE